jgi:hypothetical protein
VPAIQRKLGKTIHRLFYEIQIDLIGGIDGYLELAHAGGLWQRRDFGSPN